MFGKEIDGVEIYQVGKLQLWSWCSWTRHGFDYCRSLGNEPLYCSAESLAKGKYVVLEGTVEFGRIWSRAWIVSSYGSAKKAVAAVKELQEYDDYKFLREHSLSGNVTSHFYEIWHIVDDEGLWARWEYNSALSLEVSDEDFNELVDDAYPFGDCWDACIDACTPNDVCCCETSGCVSKVVKVSDNPTRYYYAAIHKYGVEFSNDVTALVRFPSREKRDKYVYGEHWEGRKRESVTRDLARRYASRAFADTGGVVVVDCETGADEMIYYYATRLHAQGYDAWVRLPDGSQCFVCL